MYEEGAVVDQWLLAEVLRNRATELLLDVPIYPLLVVFSRILTKDEWNVSCRSRQETRGVEGKRGLSLMRKKTLIHRFYEAVERYLQGDDHALDQLLAPQFVDHVLESGREGIFTTLQVIRESFSEIRLEVHDVIIADDIVVVHLTFDLCHTKVFLHIPPTHRRIRFRHVSALRVADGMVVERLWYLSDAFTMWQQLGSFPFASGEVSS